MPWVIRHSTRSQMMHIILSSTGFLGWSLWKLFIILIHNNAHGRSKAQKDDATADRVVDHWQWIQFLLGFGTEFADNLTRRRSSGGLASNNGEHYIIMMRKCKAKVESQGWRKQRRRWLYRQLLSERKNVTSNRRANGRDERMTSVW